MAAANHGPPAGAQGPVRRRLIARACWCLVAVLVHLAAYGVELIPLEDECRGRQLMLKGVIEPGDYDRFVARMTRLVIGEALPAVQDPEVLWTVKLDSPGGDLAEAMRIGRFLRRALAVTEVDYRFAPRWDGVWDHEPDGRIVCLDGDDPLAGCAEGIQEAECTGACLLIWLGGADRYAIQGRLGVHGLAVGAAVADYLAEMDVSADWSARLLDPAPTGDGWLSWPERVALSERAPALRDLLTGCPEPLTIEESVDTLIAASQPVRNGLLDRADAHRGCRRERLAAVRARLTSATTASVPTDG